MPTITAIIQARGGWDYLRDHPIRVEIDGYMPLCIERIGKGPRGMPALSIAMYGEQNGDMMRDPDLELEIRDFTAGPWYPYRFRNDYFGVEHEPIRVEDGKEVIDHAMVRDLEIFARQWDSDLRIQGFQ
jgi:hypothetical protein